MPALPDSQEERFCQEVANGSSQTEAAKVAGFNEAQAHNIGCRLCKRDDIAARIRELSQRVEANQIATKEWILGEALENYKMAREAEDLNTSLQCLRFIAQLRGFLVNRTESRSESFQVSLETADVAALKAVLRQSFAAVPAGEREALLLEAPEELREELCEAFEGESRRPN
jgi:hypothetical protein